MSKVPQIVGLIQGVFFQFLLFLPSSPAVSLPEVHVSNQDSLIALFCSSQMLSSMQSNMKFNIESNMQYIW